MSKPFTTEKFINDATIRFNHRFDYSTVCYRNATTKVTISCPEHGEFNISPWKFLRSKHGCKQCAVNSVALQQKETTKNNLEVCKKINSEVYDYPEFSFTSIKDKIPVMCKKHGIFYVTVDHHLRGVGCKKCADSNKTGGYNNHWFTSDPRRKDLPGVLYILEVFSENEKFIKVGITKNSVSKRYKNTPFKKYEYRILHQFYYSLYECYLKETKIKNQLLDYRHDPKSPFHHTESFIPAALPHILSFIHDHTPVF